MGSWARRAICGARRGSRPGGSAGGGGRGLVRGWERGGGFMMEGEFVEGGGAKGRN